MGKKKFNKFHLFWIIPLAFFIMMMGVGIGVIEDVKDAEDAMPITNTFGENYKIETTMACIMSQGFIEDMLKSPSTAKFQRCGDSKIEYQGNQTYFIHSYVDSQNSFGAMIRTHYSAAMLDKQNGYWSLVYYYIHE